MITKPIFPIREGRKRLEQVCFVVMMIALLILTLTTPAAAAITTGSATNASSGGANTVTIAKPEGTVAGDVLVACIVATTPYSNVDVTPPDGWQLIKTTNAFQGWYYDMVTYYKIAGANEPANYTWSSSYIATSGGITRLTGVDINHVVDVSAESQGKGSTLTVTATAPSVTTNYANDIVINFFGSYASLANPYFSKVLYTPPLTTLYEWAPAYAGGAYDPPSVAAYHWTKGSVGSTGSRNCRLSKRTATSNVWWVAQTIAFKAAPTVGFQLASSSNVEGTNRQVNLVLSSASDGPVTVNFTAGGTATPTADYTVTGGSYVIPAGSTNGYLYINSLQDNLFELDETVILNLTSASGAVIGGITTYTHTITNDDYPVPAPVIATGSSGTGVSPQGTFPPSADALLLPMAKPAGLQVGDLMLAAISWHSASDSSAIVPPEGWVSIRTTYNNGIRVATYYKIATAADISTSVVRYIFGLPGNNLMWGYHATGGITRYSGVDLAHPVDVSDAAWGNVNYSNTISAPSVNPNYSNSKIITVFGTYHPVGDISTPSGMTERYEVHYHIDPNNSQTLIWPEIAVSDMNWAPATATGAKTATVTANSPLSIGSSSFWAAQTIALKSIPLVNFHPTSSSGSESVTSVNLPVYLSSPKDAPVTVNYTVNAAGTTAKSGADYTLASGTLTFAAGETKKNIVLSVINDTEYENSETVQVTLSSPSGALLGGNPSYTYTITDNDSNPADVITYRNSNGTYGGIGGVTNHLLGIGKPSGTTTGDFLLACIVNRTDFSNVSVTPPEGWTLAGTVVNYPTRVTVFYRFAGTSPGTDPNIYSFTIGSSVYQHEDHATGTILRYTGVNPSNPVDVWAGAAAANASAIAPVVHPSFDNGRLVTVFGSYVPVSFSTPSGMTLRNSVHYHSGDTWPVDTWPGTYVFDQALDPASSSGTRTSALTPFGSHYAQWTALSLVLHD